MRIGYCMCGCGQKTALALATKTARGDIAGQPVKYIRGHAAKKHTPQYVVDAAGCWIWQWAIGFGGYGILNTRRAGRPKSTRQAHRVYYERNHGPLPANMHLHHRCGQRACVNPDHLEPLTAAEHVRLRAKLDHGKAEQIRVLLAQGWLKVDIAAAFGIKSQQVRAIETGRAWA